MLWYIVAASNGNAKSQFRVGELYDSGEPGLVPKDAARAFSFFLLAAKQGFDRAQLQVGVRYREGTGVRMTPSSYTDDSVSV